MKKRILVILFILIGNFYLNGQTPTIHFVKPTSNQEFILNSNETTKAININIWYGNQRLQRMYYIKLFAEPYGTSGGNGGSYDQWIYAAQGTYNWRAELYEGTIAGDYNKVAEDNITIYVKYSIAVANNFGGGIIYLDNQQVSSGSVIGKLVSESVSFGAIDQNDGSGYYRVWNTSGTNNSEWRKSNLPISSARDLSYSVQSGDNGAVFTAELRKVCDITFNAGSTVYVNGSPSSSASVVEGNSITATAGNYSQNDVDYTFTGWKIGTTNYGTTITPNSHETYTAKYLAKPTVASRNLSNASNPDDNVVITWNAHPSSNVTGYNVYRKVKSNGVVGPEAHLASLSASSTSYTDYEYIVTNSPNDDRLMYDVRPVYTDADNTAIESDPYYVTIAYGLMHIKMNKDERVITQANLIPDTYSISNHPNPFNPTTVINYQLPAEGFVTIKVYDMLGKEIAELVNENKAAGYYRVNFDASKLASGIYIYSINAGSFSSSKKMILTK